MSAFFSLDISYLISFFVAVFAASFALPTGAMILIVSFASVATGWIGLGIVVIVSLLATILGDYAAYIVCRYFRNTFTRTISTNIWMTHKVTKIDTLFSKYGSYTVFLSRFVLSSVGPYVNFWSGLRNMHQWKFLKAVILGEMVYTFLFVGIGYMFRETWQQVMIIAQDYVAFSVFILLSCFVIYRIVRVYISKYLKNSVKS